MSGPAGLGGQKGRLSSAGAAVAALLIASCGGSGGDDALGRAPSSGPSTGAPLITTGPATGPIPRLTVPGEAAPPSATATTVLPAVDLRPGGAPPWAGAKITSGAARRVGLDEWTVAENRDSARLVLPADVALSPAAEPRPAIFSGGWAVAWDERTGPGIEPTGAFCENCGRGVAGVAATSIPATKAFAAPFTNVVQWSDGSGVGYTGARSDNRQFLADLFVNGQGRQYQVWSYLSQRHLEYLISQLRFVEGAP